MIKTHEVTFVKFSNRKKKTKRKNLDRKIREARKVRDRNMATLLLNQQRKNRELECQDSL